MAKYEMKYMFDFASGVCVWSVNATAREKYGYPVKAEALPISNELVHILQDLIARYDNALNWADPASELLWSDEEKELWYDEVKAAYKTLCSELSPDYSLSFQVDQTSTTTVYTGGA